MKKDIIKLALFLFLGLSVSSYAQNMNKGNRLNKKTEKNMIGHVNPLPNFMKVIVNNGDKLDLDKNQKENFATWQAENNPKVMKLTKEIMSLEKEVHNLSMNKEDKEIVLKKIDNIAALRKNIAVLKTACRDNLIKTLSDVQWKKLLTLYQATEG